MGKKRSKIELAQIIVREVNGWPSMPAENHPSVVALAKSQTWAYLNGRAVALIERKLGVAKVL